MPRYSLEIHIQATRVPEDDFAGAPPTDQESLIKLAGKMLTVTPGTYLRSSGMSVDLVASACAESLKELAGTIDRYAQLTEMIDSESRTHD